MCVGAIGTKLLEWSAKCILGFCKRRMCPQQKKKVDSMSEHEVIKAVHEDQARAEQDFEKRVQGWLTLTRDELRQHLKDSGLSQSGLKLERQQTSDLK